MSKYRKKPVVVEATQWFKSGDHEAVVKNVYNKTIGFLSSNGTEKSVFIQIGLLQM